HLSLARPTLLLFCIPTATPQTHTLSLHDALPILATLKDLPAKRETTAHVRAAMALIEAGATSAGSRKAKPPPELPDDLAAAMRGNQAARGHWDTFTPGKQREYADWITGAKGADTRARRVAQAVEWIAEGKTRNWKYAGC